MTRKTQALQEEIKTLQRIKDIWDNRDYAESVRKAPKMSTHDILNWIDNYITEIGKTAEDYRRYGDTGYLLELRRAVSILQALTEELMARRRTLSLDNSDRIE